MKLKLEILFFCIRWREHLDKDYSFLFFLLATIAKYKLLKTSTIPISKTKIPKKKKVAKLKKPPFPVVWFNSKKLLVPISFQIMIETIVISDPANSATSCFNVKNMVTSFRCKLLFSAFNPLRPEFIRNFLLAKIYIFCIEPSCKSKQRSEQFALHIQIQIESLLDIVVPFQ